MQLACSYGDGKWADLAHQHIEGGRLERAAFLPFGTANGNPTVEILVRTEAGLFVHANTTYALWKASADVFSHWERRIR